MGNPKLAPFPYNPYDSLTEVPGFTLTSTDLADGGTVPARHTSGNFGVPGGEDLSPQLAWSGFPEGTRSFAVTCLDPDAPTGSGFWHWAVLDLPAEVTELATGAGSPGSDLLPAGAITLRNDAGYPGYVGSGPPEGHGQHRYFFTVHAVDVEKLGVDGSASPAVLGFNLNFHTLARAQIVANFGR